MRKADRKGRKEYDKYYLVRMHGVSAFNLGDGEGGQIRLFIRLNCFSKTQCPNLS